MPYFSNDYFNWLCEQVSVGKYALKKLSYLQILKHLYNKPFSYILSDDENRYNDGYDLRYSFITEMSESPFIIDEISEDHNFCSVLEMMVRLSMKCENIMYDPDVDNSSSRWFWQMIDNLGLSEYEDFYYNFDKVDSILDMFLRRAYDRKGSFASLFSTNDENKDMTRIPIWKQMHGYLIENYLGGDIFGGLSDDINTRT